jgi:hypothetical protein
MKFNVDIVWDEEGNEWVATSDDVRGLVLNSGSVDVLIERVRFAIPDLIDVSGPFFVNFNVQSYPFGVVYDG